MPASKPPDTLHPDEKGFGALVERVGNVQESLAQLVDEMRRQTETIKAVTDDSNRTKWQVEALQERLLATERDLQTRLQQQDKQLREEIERGSLRKIWGNATSILSGLVSLVALLVALGLFKSP